MEQEIKKKWGIMFKAILMMIALLIVRTAVDLAGLDVIPITPVVGAFITGAIFTIAIIFTGTFTDFKESEKVGSELATSLKALYNDSRVLPVTDESMTKTFRAHLRGVHRTIRDSLLENRFSIEEVNRAMDLLNNDVRALAYANVAPPLIAKLRNEMGAIDRICNRIEVIIRTDFIPAAYALAEIATGGVILLLLFIKMDGLAEGAIIFAVITMMLIGLLLLIHDMDNPFEFGPDAFADVDLESLVMLEKYFDEQDAAIEKRGTGKA
ncbi:hypothetical protein [Methanoregula formicica]|uniref:Uncharacterized protein n=1 Tax=Methanoregula formicica (strain DSM 22288 / NBRC 105244 / SMSP) TaxID=593750 RepID=L0HDQ3_METFS|nr:hypothetical protein [Methanoregula formicica]AGB02857.1 hypothetical protein Metfor_1834 [Methanoregula formicica SMSP]